MCRQPGRSGNPNRKKTVYRSLYLIFYKYDGIILFFPCKPLTFAALKKLKGKNAYNTTISKKR